MYSVRTQYGTECNVSKYRPYHLYSDSPNVSSLFLKANNSDALAQTQLAIVPSYLYSKPRITELNFGIFTYGTLFSGATDLPLVQDDACVSVV